MYLIKTR